MAVHIKKPSEKTGGSKYAAHLEAGQPQGTVSTKVKSGDSEVASMTTHKVAGWMVNEGPVAQLKVGGGKTIALPAYNSVKLYVEVTIPCAVGALNEGYDFATTWVSDKLAEAEASIQEMKGA